MWDDKDLFLKTKIIQSFTDNGDFSIPCIDMLWRYALVVMKQANQQINAQLSPLPDSISVLKVNKSGY